MSAIKLAIITAVVAEAALYGITVLLKTIGPGTGAFGTAALYFHLPGVLVANLLFGDSGKPAIIPFVIFSGVLQFFLIAWVAITWWRKRA